MAPPRKSKKEKSKGNKGRNDGSSKLKPPPPQLPAAAAVATSKKKKAAAVVSSSTKSFKDSKKKKKKANEKSLLLKEAPSLSHPYMEVYYKKRIPITLQQIQKMEESVLLKLTDRSKWRSYPSGPQECYEKDRCTGRITHIKIMHNNNTFYHQLQLIRDAVANNNSIHVRLPRSIGPRPMWRMTKDIAIMDQLQIINLYRCTGRLPKSMNYLAKLTSLQLDGCRDIDLSLLGLGCDVTNSKKTTTYTHTGGGTLHNLIELKIVDCENLTPSKFQNLSNLKSISLMRWDKSNNNTINLRERWINELSLATTTSVDDDDKDEEAEASVLPTAASTSTSLTASSTNDNNTGSNNDNNVPVSLQFKFQFRCSLQYLTFSGSCITNKDLGNILFKMLSKFPNLDTLVVNHNPEINSFKEACDVSTRTTSSLLVRSNLRTLKLVGTKIKINNEELDSVIYFLEKLYPTVGTMKVFKYDTSCGVVVGGEDHNAASNGINNSNISNSKPGRRTILLPFDQADRVRRIEYLLAMNSTNAFGLTGTTAGNPQTNDPQIAASLSLPTLETNYLRHQQQQQHKQLPLSVWPLALSKAFRKSYRTFNRKSYRTCNPDRNLLDKYHFKKDIRHDVVYHLLRNGPIFPSSGHSQRYKRRREYYSRGCKKIKAC